MRRTARRFAPLLACVAILAVAPLARADDSSTVTVVGTSDVFDSNLVQDVLQPGFEAAYPQYHLNYVSKGTGAAIAYAEAGTASGLLVHAASLENQFVDQGYSNEQYGRALFYGDYVLLGPASDPAGVMTNAPHDIVGAFERIATAGDAGHANFVSRGGTPGTTVQEHLIWAQTSGVSSCQVSDANGGGQVPSTTTGACPSTATPPSWYHTTGLTQGPNIQAGDACTFPGGGCYVLTDRGTFDYLQSQHSAQNLVIVTRDNAAAARGGSTILVNSFHGYVLKPGKFGDPDVHINVPGATAFLDYVTSPAGQAAVGRYLDGGGDPPFLPDAAPSLSGGGLLSTVNAGTPVTVTGVLRNIVPGTPPLNGESVVLSTPDGQAGTATTGAGGSYSVTFTPVANASYTVSTPGIAKIENVALNPVFGDLLQPATAAVGSMNVQSLLSLSAITKAYRQIVVGGTVAPGSGHVGGVVTVAVRKGTSGDFRNVAFAPLATNQAGFSIPVTLAPGAHEVMTRFDDPGRVLGAVGPATKVTVPGHAFLSIRSLKVRRGVMTMRVRFTKAQTTGGHLYLYGRQVKKLVRAGKAAAGKLRRVGKRRTVSPGQRSATLHFRLARGHRWQLQLRYTHPHAIDPVASRLRTVNVR